MSCREALAGADARRELLHMAIYERDFENSVWARRVLREQRQRAAQPDSIVEEMRREGRRALRDPAAAGGQRLQAALVLGEIGDARATAALIAGLEAPNVAARQHAVHALGQISDRRAVPALIGALRDREPLIQATAYDSLQRQAGAGDERARAAVREYAGPRFNQPLPR
jgi:HEAT repeat protein